MSQDYRNNLPYGAPNSPEREAYNAEACRIEAAFRAEVEAEYLTPGLPQEIRDAVYSLAYEHGHSAGYSEVRCYYPDFAELANLAYRLGCTTRS